MLSQSQIRTLFSDPKLNAMRQAAVAGDWQRLFEIAPRGCVGGAGVTDAAGRSGVCGDMPGVQPPSARGEAAYRYWRGGNPLRKNLIIQDLRYRRRADGTIEFVPVTRAELTRLWERYNWARHDWRCTPGQVQEMINRWLRTKEIYVTHQCAEPSSARRKKLVKRVAVGAAIATGAAFLGPAIGTAAKAAGTKIAGALGATGKAIGTAATTIATGGRSRDGDAALVGNGKITVPRVGDTRVGGTRIGDMSEIIAIDRSGQNAFDNLISTVNDARTVKAIVEGERPPPPIAVTEGNFTLWAFQAAQQELEKHLQRKMQRAEEAALLAEIKAMQREIAARVPADAPKSPDPRVPAPVQEKSAQLAAERKQAQNNVLRAAAIGLPLAILLKG